MARDENIESVAPELTGREVPDGVVVSSSAEPAFAVGDGGERLEGVEGGIVDVELPVLGNDPRRNFGRVHTPRCPTTRQSPAKRANGNSPFTMRVGALWRVHCLVSQCPLAQRVRTLAEALCPV